MKKKGKYYNSLKAYTNARGNPDDILNAPSIHTSGSVKGMRKQFWGYECDIVRCGNWIYKVS